MRRSMLFVPGNNPKMMTSCGFFGADAIIFDLEDAVSPDEKDAARILVKYAVTNVERCRSEIIVRVNAADTPLFAQDLEAIVPAERLPRGGHGKSREPHPHRHPLSPRHLRGRLAGWLRRRRGNEKGVAAARAGGQSMTCGSSGGCPDYSFGFKRLKGVIP